MKNALDDIAQKIVEDKEKLKKAKKELKEKDVAISKKKEEVEAAEKVIRKIEAEYADKNSLVKEIRSKTTALNKVGLLCLHPLLEMDYFLFLIPRSATNAITGFFYSHIFIICWLLQDITQLEKKVMLKEGVVSQVLNLKKEVARRCKLENVQLPLLQVTSFCCCLVSSFYHTSPLPSFKVERFSSSLFSCTFFLFFYSHRLLRTRKIEKAKNERDAAAAAPWTRSQRRRKKKRRRRRRNRKRKKRAPNLPNLVRNGPKRARAAMTKRRKRKRRIAHKIATRQKKR